MENTVLSAAEAVEYGEFKRAKREAEIAASLKKLIVDASRRETDRFALRSACEGARKLDVHGVLVSPVNVAPAKRLLEGSKTYVIGLIGGTGETLISVKKLEAKSAIRQGARELRLVLCYSALRAGNASYLKKEVKKIRRAAKKLPLVVSLEDHSLGEEEIARGTRAACEGGAEAVCVRGEVQLVLRALRAGNGKVRVDAADVENAEQYRSLVRAGASLSQTKLPERIAKEMYDAASEEAGKVSAVRISNELLTEKDPV